MNRFSGISLIEMLVCLSLIAILATVSVPFWYQTKKKQLDLYQEKLTQSIYLARTEAIKRNRTMTLCGTHNGQTCTDEWSQGLLILDHKTPLYTVTLKKNNALSCENQHAHTKLYFNPLGKPINPSGTTFKCRIDRHSFKLILSLIGRVRIEKQ